jgi:hypothetical protein
VEPIIFVELTKKKLFPEVRYQFEETRMAEIIVMKFRFKADLPNFFLSIFLNSIFRSF